MALLEHQPPPAVEVLVELLAQQQLVEFTVVEVEVPIHQLLPTLLLAHKAQ
jgi:hypothetical protein